MPRYKTQTHREYSKRKTRLIRWMSLDSYDDFLKSKYWKLLKEYAFSQKQSKTCFFCKLEDSIVLHHVRYSKIYVPSLKYILPLCHRCHEEIHTINFTSECSVVDATMEVARRFRVADKVVKQLGNKGFYKKFWDSGCKQLESGEMKQELYEMKRRKKLRKEERVRTKSTTN
jgi:hypothetical protein